MKDNMMKGIISTTFCLAILTIGRCEPPSTNYGTPVAPPISSYGTPNYQANGQDLGDHGGGGGGHGDHGHDGEPKAYEFGYQVKDEYTGTDYNRRESSDGNQVRGEYRVALPDGRLQIVTYWADWQSGFHADVRYEGEAQYPDQYNKAGGGYQQGGYPQGGAGGYSQGGGGYQQGSGGYQQGGYQQQGNGGYSGGGGGYAGGNDGYNYNSNNNNYNYNDGGYNQNTPSNVYGPV